MPAALLTLFALFTADAAGASAPPIAIAWVAPEGCPTEEQFRTEIARLVGAVPAAAEPTEVRVTVGRAGDGGWALTLGTRAGGHEGERQLAAADCDTLMRAAALVVALMINPNAGMPEPVQPPPPPPPPPVKSSPHELAVGAEVLLSSGLQPGAVAPGAELRVDWGGRLAGELRAGLWAGRRATSAADASAGGDLSLASFVAAGCGRVLGTHRIAPGGCAGIALLRAHATGFGVSDPGAATAWWEAALLEANLRVRISTRQAVRVALSGLVPLGRPTFALAGIGSVYEPPPIAVQAALGWEVHF